MNRIFLALALASLLAGCGSTVKLDDVAVEDKTGTPVARQPGAGSLTPGAGTTGSAGNVTRTAIAPVELGKPASDAAPLSGPRIIYFDYDSFVLKPEFQDMVDAHARYIKADKNRKVFIEGHTDERGGREYNLALGQKRAEAVRRALGLLGVTDSQVEAVSFGKEKPAVQGSDEAALAKNRRAEIAYR